MGIDQVKKAKKGNKLAFEEIIMENIDYLYRVAYGMLQNENDISDAVSATVLKAFEKIKSLKKEEYFRTWITRILINECNNLLREKKKIVYIEDYNLEKEMHTKEEEVQIDIKTIINSLEDDLKKVVI